MNAGPPNINSLVFPKSSFQLIFFSLFTPCSLFSLLSVLSVVTAWWWLVTAWWWLRRDPRRVGGYGETHGVVVVTERPTAWLFSQICNHRGQPPPRRDPRRGSLLRSVQTEASHHHAAKHEPRWWSLPISTVAFGC
uniref:Uncharacterized protein n=1 Tax=Fagus sylvatica TaxID=28930 RepID=A0A2N9IAV5_FAGSY